MKTIKVGIIGAGAIAHGHAHGVNAHPQAEVVAVADVSDKRAKGFQKDFNLSKRFSDYKKMLADPDIDAVSVGLPNFLHAPVSIDALNAGKHVMLDKPFALNVAEAQRVIKTAKSNRRVFMLGMNQRFNPSSQIVRALVERGELGEIYHAKAFWLRRSGSPRFGTWFVNKKLAGGGAMLDIGVHMLDLCLYLMNNWKPVAVSGAAYTKFGNRGLGEGGWGKSDRNKKMKFDVDDFAFGLIKFKNGATVQIEASWALHQEQGDRHDVQLYGDKGGASAFPAKLYRFGKKKGEYEVVIPEGVKVHHPHGNRFYNWIDTILKKAKPETTMEQSLTVQKILDALYLSSKSGKEVRIKSP